MIDTSNEFLTEFFRDHLPFTPTAGQVDTFQADLSLVSPYLMRASLKEVKAGTLGNVLVYRPGEWRSAIFTVYNRKVAEHAQLFPVFHSFETAFRSTVAVMLEHHYQHKRWWRPIYDQLRNGRPAKTVATIGRQSISKDAAHAIGQIIFGIDGESFQRNTIGGIDNGFQFLECCNLNHVSRLITTHWVVFSPRFTKPTKKLTLADFEGKFSRVTDARNDIYHHKSLARMSDVVTTAEELLDFLDFSLSFVFQKVTACKLAPLTFLRPVESRHRTW